MNSNKFSFEDLNIWKDSITITKDVYSSVKKFPTEEKFGLSSQLTRAVTSITLNISEGSGYYSSKKFIAFLYQARGSLCEVVACIRIALELNYISKEEYLKIKNSLYTLNAKINGMISYLKRRIEINS